MVDITENLDTLTQTMLKSLRQYCAEVQLNPLNPRIQPRLSENPQIFYVKCR